MNKLVLATMGTGAVLTISMAVDGPPVIPSGPVQYDSVAYSPEVQLPVDSDVAGFHAGVTPATPDWQGEAAPAPTPISEISPAEKNFSMTLNLYTSNYNVRGMGFTNEFTQYGYSSIDAEYTFANRNLFGWGVYHQINGTVGVIWGEGDELGDTPVLRAGYALGKEIFPNLHWKVGYNLQHGGIEGYLAKHRDKCSQRITQNVYTSLEFDDHQQGIYGGLLFGAGLQGLTGVYGDAKIGYRFADLLDTQSFGGDLEVEFGLSYSHGYWTGSAEGIDAYRIRANFKPYTKSGSLGRDSGKVLTPWAMVSWAGNNEDKIQRDLDYGIVDKVQFTVGVDMGWSF